MQAFPLSRGAERPMNFYAALKGAAAAPNWHLLRHARPFLSRLKRKSLQPLPDWYAQRAHFVAPKPNPAPVASASAKGPAPGARGGKGGGGLGLFYEISRRILNPLGRLAPAPFAPGLTIGGLRPKDPMEQFNAYDGPQP